MAKRPIPQPNHDADPALKAIKENIEVITGQRGQKLPELPITATLADVIAWLNQLRATLQ